MAVISGGEHSMRVCILIGLVLWPILAVTGCTGSGNDPESISRAWVDAVIRGDKQAARNLTVAEGRAIFEEGSTISLKTDFTGLTFGALTLTGDTAEIAVCVPVKAAEADMESKSSDIVGLLLSREDGQWRVSGTKCLIDGGILPMPFAVGVNMAESMNEAMEAWGSGVRDTIARGGTVEELEQKFQANAAYTPYAPESYRAQWQNATDFSGKSVGVAITQLALECGLGVEPEEHEAALAVELDEPLTGLTRLEAIDRAATIAGLVAQFPMGEYEGARDFAFPANPFAPVEHADDEDLFKAFEEPGAPAIHFTPGVRAYPLQFSGPFVIGLCEFSDYAAYGTGELLVRYVGYGLSPLSVEGMPPMERTRLLPIVSASGNDLSRWVFWDDSESIHDYQGIYQILDSRPLLGLLRGMESIPEVAGEVFLCLPRKVDVFEFEATEVGAVSQSGDKKMYITYVGEKSVDVCAAWKGASESLQDSYAYRLEEINAATVCQWALRDVGGLPIAAPNQWIIRGRESYKDVLRKIVPKPGDAGPVSELPDVGTEDMAVIRISANLPFSSVKVYVLSDFEKVGHPFTLTDIPLREWPARPDKFQELTYEGHDAPVSIELMALNFTASSVYERKNAVPQVRVTNHSNKPVWKVGVRAQYTDVAGEESTYDFLELSNDKLNDDAMPVPVAGPAEERVIDAPAFPVWMNTEKVELAMLYVIFMDGTNWQPKPGGV
jgi:hypothetical protein